MAHKTIKNFAKLRLILPVIALVASFLGTSFIISQPVYAAGCAGTKAPSGADCGQIPLGCPGSLKAGPIDVNKASLTCPYSPSGSFNCPAKKCVYKDTASLNADKCPDGKAAPGGNINQCPVTCTQNGKVVECKNVTDQAASSGNCSSLAKCDLITRYANPVIAFFSALVGVAVTIAIIIGGIQYSSSAGDPQKAAAAKSRIQNAIIALVAFFLLFALLSWIVPGGL